ncbi:MAG: sensor histidine kinase [Fusicatenibacter sp.]|nr:sensor histidine kinase [Fusicatenibacter sp.]
MTVWAGIKKRFSDMKVHSKLVAVYLITGLLPMCIMFTIFYTQIRNVLMEREIKNLQGAFQQTADALDTKLALYQSMSDYLAFNQTIVRIVKSENQNSYDAYERIVKEFDPLMDSLGYFYPDVIQTTVYVRGSVIPHGEYLRSIEEVAGDPWADLTDNAIHWYVNKEKKLVSLVRSMPYLDGGQGGVLYIALDGIKLFDSMELSMDGDCGLFVYDGEELMYENIRNVKNRDSGISFETFLEEKEKESSGYVTMEHELLENGWQVGCYMPKNQMVSPMQPVLLLVLFIWVICAVLSFLTIMLFAGNMSVRIQNLSHVMIEVEEGNLEAELPVSEQDEIGDLTRGFNHMLAKIRQLIQEVYESRIRQKQYEMTALRAQINPHFLYNSLSLINWKALEKGADDISRATLALSRYYRTSLNKGKNVMSIREELDNVRAYLEIQEMFHDYSFEVVTEVSEEILDLETLNLILQPLAENAIVHGIDRMRSGRGRITLSGHLEGNDVVLSVEDNGVGMPPEKAREILSSKSSGYGVRNVNSRIQLQYGEAYGLSVQSEEGKGTRMTVRFPAVKRT